LIKLKDEEINELLAYKDRLMVIQNDYIKIEEEKEALHGELELL
jgi:hypothetical protein